MATDIVGSLFGVTPEMLQQRQFEMADRQAQEYAQMSPLQRASYGLARGGYQLAGALGGEDPQLRMVSTRNAIARQIDPTDPQSMMRGIQALQQAGDQVGAMQLAAVYQQRMKVLADIGQSEAAAASSRATTGKTVAETSALRAKEAALAASARRYFGGAAGQTEATAQPAAVEAAPAPYFNESVIADLPARVQDDIRTVLGDAAQLRNIPEDELRSARATARLKSADALDRQAASILAATQRSARGFSTPAETQEVDAALALLRPPQAAPVTRDAPASPAAPAAAAAAPARTAASEDRITAIQRRLDTILPDRDAGLKAAEIEGKQLEEELKFLREAAKPTEIERLIARREQLIAGGAQPDNAALRDISGRIANLQGREVRFGEQREAYAIQQFRKPFAQLTQEQQKIINDRVDAEAAKPRVSITNQLPGVRALADIPAFRRSVQATIDPQLKSIDAADQALQAIDDSIRTNNFVSFNAARVQLAKALGDSQLSRRDVEQAGGDPSLIGGLYDATSRLFTGTPSLDTQNKIKATLNAIRTVADRKARSEVDVQRNIALSIPGYDPAAVERALSFPQLQPRAGATGAGSLAEQARAELARRQAGGR
jgi:hypothetical protein